MTRGKARISGLDGVRAVAVLAVVLAHLGGPFGNGGYIGVELFFVLSGFLITRLLLVEIDTAGTVDFLAFYARRALRLLPALVAVLALLTVLALAAPDKFGDDHPFLAILSALFYVSNWYRISADGIGLLNHTWSLAIEEQFYLVWPPLLLLLTRGRSTAWRGRLIGLLCTLIVAIFFWRMWLNGRVDGFDRIYAGSDTRGDALLFGCLLALVVQDRIERLRSVAAAAVFLIASATYCLLVLRPIQSPFTYWHGVSFSAALCFLIVSGVALNVVPWVTRLLDLPPAAWIGRRSYGIYLWHYPILVLLVDEFGDALWIRAVGVALSFVVAGLSYRYIESPFLQMKPAPRGQEIPEAARASADRREA